jgi:hypothetical protein
MLDRIVSKPPRYAFRALRKSPAFAAVAILSLARYWSEPAEP